MRRAQLFIIVLIILVIFTIGTIIFTIDNYSPLQKPLPPKQPSSEGVLKSTYYTDESRSILYLYTKIDKVKKNNNRVFAEITMVLDEKSTRFDIILFDKEIYPALAIRLSSDKDNLYAGGSKAKFFNDANSIFNIIKRMEGSFAQVLLPLQPPPDDTSVLECNSSLLSYLSDSIKVLNCVPFTLQIAAYEN